MRKVLLPGTLPALILAGCLAESEENGPAVPGAKRVFASSNLHNGNLGGTAGADALCATWARAADLDGNWQAFLSTSSVSAPARLISGGPWYTVSRKTRIFNNKTGFTVGAIEALRAGGAAWMADTGTGPQACSAELHVYCFEK